MSRKLSVPRHQADQTDSLSGSGIRYCYQYAFITCRRHCCWCIQTCRRRINIHNRNLLLKTSIIRHCSILRIAGWIIVKSVKVVNVIITYPCLCICAYYRSITARGVYARCNLVPSLRPYLFHQAFGKKDRCCPPLGIYAIFHTLNKVHHYPRQHYAEENDNHYNLYQCKTFFVAQKTVLHNAPCPPLILRGGISNFPSWVKRGLRGVT